MRAKPCNLLNERIYHGYLRARWIIKVNLNETSHILLLGLKRIK